MHYVLGFLGFLSLVALAPMLWVWAENGAGRSRQAVAISAILAIGLTSAVLMSGYPQTDDCFRFGTRTDAFCY